MNITFPKNFLWGAATSAYQTEGGNKNSDWWRWEEEAGLKERSGAACRHYELFRDDFDLARSLNHNAHRLSVEWSRIEPANGEFSAQEIGHYVDVIDALRQRNIEPIVTLHHFTNPAWFADLGGWQNKEARRYFLRYAQRIAEALCDKVRFWVTINEPLVYVYYSYILGQWPPQERSFLKAQKVTGNLVRSHIDAHRLIHNIYKNRGLPAPLVSIAKNIVAFEPCGAGLKNRFAAFLRDRMYNFGILNRLIRERSLDFIGVNYYTRHLVEVKGWGPRNFLSDVRKDSRCALKKNSLGWEIYPQGLCNMLLRLNRCGLPLFILENGVCAQDDNERWDFIYEHLRHIGLAMQGGAKIMGYIYWSLMDNYEWDKGFGCRFGLVEVDYGNYKRTVRESAVKFASVCKSGVI